MLLNRSHTCKRLQERLAKNGKYFKKGQSIQIKFYCVDPKSEVKPREEGELKINETSEIKDQVDNLNAEPLPATPVKTDLRSELLRKVGLCMELSKARLGFLVAVTTAVGYLLGPQAIVMSKLIYTSVGTSLAIASANTLNQYREVEHDEKMKRTSGRVLPSGRMTKQDAMKFAIVTGTVGPAILFFGVNTYAAVLAFSNILLYAWIYTSLKRVHYLNTWIGAVVGAVPPLIGWTANCGEISAAGIVLFLYLFIWQIPHFLSLSWALKEDYNRANFKMLVVSDQDEVAGTTLRYSLGLLPLGFLAYYCDFMSSFFVVSGTAVSLGVMVYPSIVFYKDQTSAKARKVFRASLLYLPLLMLLMIVDKFVIQPYLEKDEEKNLIEEKIVLSE